MTVNIYTANGQYDKLVSFATSLLDAGINAIITNSLMIYAQPGQSDLVESMAPLSGLQITKYDGNHDDKAAKKSSADKNPATRKMRRSW